MSHCETCRFAKPGTQALWCARISWSKDYPTPERPAVLEGYEDDADGGTKTGTDRNLLVLPTFGCVLWEEP